jgi:hypothetical protein
MKPNCFAVFETRGSCVARTIAVLLAVGLSTAVSAQSSPPVQGTVALEGTMNKFYRASNVVIVATVDGIEHAYRFAKDLVVHGGKGAGVDALEGLREGSTVVVHLTPHGAEQAADEIDVIGDEGLRVTEAVVTRLDRRHHEMTVRYSDGRPRDSD